MVIVAPNVSPAGKYSIGETCKLLGIDRHTLLKYTNIGRIKCQHNTVNYRKYYTGYEILRFWNKY